MAPTKKRTDIYNLNVLATKMPYKNAYTKLLYFFKGFDNFTTKDEAQETIDLLNEEHKATIANLKKLLK